LPDRNERGSAVNVGRIGIENDSDQMPGEGAA